jgi:hypothetical protein
MFTSKKTSSQHPAAEQPTVEEAWAVSSQRAVSDDGCPKCNRSAAAGTAAGTRTSLDVGNLQENLGLGDDNWLYMSAVCFVYGRAIQKHTGKPVGLVNTNWGGTPVEFWMSEDAEAACATNTTKPPAAGGAYNGKQANEPAASSCSVAPLS